MEHWHTLHGHWMFLPLLMPIVMLGAAFVFWRFVLRPARALPAATQDSPEIIEIRRLLEGWADELPSSLLGPLLQRAEGLGAVARTSPTARAELRALAADLHRFNERDRMHEIGDLRADVDAVGRALAEVRGSHTP